MALSSLVGVVLILIQVISIIYKKFKKVKFLNFHEKEKLIIIFMCIMIFIFEGVAYYSKKMPNLIDVLPVATMIITLILFGVFVLGKITDKKFDEK